MQQLLQKLKQFQRKLQIASAEAVTALVKLQIAPAEAETHSEKVETVSTHSAVAPAVVPEKLIKLISPSLVKS